MTQRIQIVAGGTPTDEEMAALVVALTPVVRRDHEQHLGPPPWRRAAILEALGGRPVSGAADLAARRGRGV